MLLGMDFGSSGCKGVLFGPDGSAIAKAGRAYRPQTVDGDGCEMDPEVFYTAFCEVVHEVAAAWPVTAIGLSSHGETVIPVGRDGRPAGPALMNADNRGMAQTEALARELPREKLYTITGLPAHPMYSLPKMMWLKDNCPEIFDATWKFCDVPAFLLARMGIEPRSENTLACRTLAFDIHEMAWSDEILAAAGMPGDMLCGTVPAGVPVGTVPAGLAAALGLGDGVTLVLAGHDQPCGAYGAGLTTGGVALSAGSYECVCRVGPKPANSPDALRYSFNSYCHVCPGSYVTLGFFPAAICQDWYARLLYPDIADPDKLYPLLFSELEGMQAGPTGLLATPHLVGACNPQWNPAARGGIYGLQPGVTRAALMKGLLEGMACELRLNLDAMEAMAETSQPIYTHGGNARHNWGMQLRADVTGRAFLRLDDRDTGCRGAAMLAGVGAGVFRDYETAAQLMRADGALFRPNHRSTAAYAPQFQRYKRFSRAEAWLNEA